MSAATPHIDLTPPAIVKTISQRSLIIGVIFAIISGALAFFHPEEFYRGYLLGFMCWLGISLGSMAILMIRHLTGGGWGTVIRRILGAAMRTLPLLAVLFIPLAFSVLKHSIYPWAVPVEAIENPGIREHLIKNSFVRSYLNPTGFIIRAVIYFAIWNVLSFLLSKWSKQTDSPSAPNNSQRFKAVSGPGLILYAFTIGFAAIDWLMSFDPTWVSTMFGLIVLANELLLAMCFAVVVERILFNYKPMSELLKPDFVHDHGKWILTFTMVWAYFSFSQWLIIWAGNLPQEITFYLRRLNGGWGWIGLILAFLGFVAPFATLLSRPLKRNIRKLVWVAIWLLVIRYLDLFWIIEPNFSKTLTVTLADIVVPIAIGGIWLWYFFRNLGSLPLVPAYDHDAHEVLQPEHHIHSQGTP
ncbi:MAG: hypothetical protein ACLQLC_13160 [Candidatus Sulfotelmatobacter sp.]